MPMPRKPDPVKFCAECGKQLVRKRSRNGQLESLLHFGRRKFCDRMCMARNFDGRESREIASWAGMHYRARKKVAPGACQACGKPDAEGVRTRAGEKSTDAGKPMPFPFPICEVESWTAAVPAARASFGV